jgi:hypothetical protein
VTLLAVVFSSPELDVLALAFTGFYLVLGLAAILVGSGLRQLRRWTVIPVGLLSGIGLLGFPIGTLINGYIL